MRDTTGSRVYIIYIMRTSRVKMDSAQVLSQRRLSAEVFPVSKSVPLTPEKRATDAT